MGITTSIHYDTDDEVLNKMKRAQGHPFKDFDIDHRLEKSKNKGSLGQIIEHGVLGIENNSRAEPDIPNLNLEIKTTGIINLSNHKLVSAKERLALENLNYDEVATTEFEDSNLWHKCRKILFVFYEYLYDVSYGDFTIGKSVINDFSSTGFDRDLEIIKKDYNEIRGKILAGKADEISEGDTMYLGACTSGTGKLSLEKRSGKMVKERKFCLKTGYMNSLVRKYFREVEYVTNPMVNEIRADTFEMELQQRLQPYYGWSEEKIRRFFNLNVSKDAKNRYERYIAAMLGFKGKINNSEEFKKSNMELKTIRVQKNGSIKESMSFPCFDFRDVVDQTWEDSDVREMFSSAKFMFAIFQETDEGMVFDHIKFWNFDERELDEKVEPVFNSLKNTLSSGKIVYKIAKDKNGKDIRYNNFPGMADNDIVHIRPHTKDSNSTCPLPTKDKMTGATEYTKQCFWIKNSYIKKIINE